MATNIVSEPPIHTPMFVDKEKRVMSEEWIEWFSSVWNVIGAIDARVEALEP